MKERAGDIMRDMFGEMFLHEVIAMLAERVG